MLTEKDLDRLFNLLEHVHSGKKAKRDEETRLGWLETLRPWTYQQVREAAFRRAQTGNRFFPDAPEIAAFCPPAEQNAVRPAQPPPSWGKQLAFLRQHQDLRAKRRAAGLPGTWMEAQRAGLSAADWASQMDAAGLSVEGIL